MSNLADKTCPRCQRPYYTSCWPGDHRCHCDARTREHLLELIAHVERVERVGEEPRCDHRDSAGRCGGVATWEALASEGIEHSAYGRRFCASHLGEYMAKVPVGNTIKLKRVEQ